LIELLELDVPHSTVISNVLDVVVSNVVSFTNSKPNPVTSPEFFFVVWNVPNVIIEPVPPLPVFLIVKSTSNLNISFVCPPNV
jgi:hypothetical protein